MNPTKEQLADPKWWDENAPEGATHFIIDSDGCVEDFFAVEQDDRYKDVDSDSYLMKSDVVGGGWIVLARTPQWTGEGLPPVGTVCEVYHCDEWLRGKVIAHFQQRAGLVAAYTVEVGSVGSGIKHLDSAIGECFRLIRTPEMIEAEEREKAIREMRHIAEHDAHSRTVDYGALYDHGYRKTDQELVSSLRSLAEAYRGVTGIDGAYEQEIRRAEGVLKRYE